MIGINDVRQQVAAAASGGAAFAAPANATATDGADVAFSLSGNSFQAITEAMSGSATTNPSTLQKVAFFNSSIQAQNILSMEAKVLPTATIEETSAITAPVILVVGWVAVPDGGSPTIANLATYKSRWLAIRINGPHIQIDPGQDNGTFAWGSNLNLDVTAPTDYTWVAKVAPQLYRNLEPQTFFTNLIGFVSYAGTSGAQTFEAAQSDGGNDDLNDDDVIHTFIGVGRQATGGSQRTVALEIPFAVVALPS